MDFVYNVDGEFGTPVLFFLKHKIAHQLNTQSFIAFHNVSLQVISFKLSYKY